MIDVGSKVKFEGQDSYYKGTVVAMFRKLDKEGKQLGPWRCVVQDDRGLLLIKDPFKATLLIEIVHTMEVK